MPGIVGRPQQPVHIIQKLRDLHFSEGMVTQCHRIGSCIIDPPGMVTGQAHACHILAVDHSEGNVLFLFQTPQLTLQPDKTTLAYHIANCQHTNFHPDFSFSKLPAISRQAQSVR